MLDIALHQDAGAISVVDIAVRQGISASYLEQIFGKLKRAGLLLSSRGPGGGYRLTRELEAINVADIVTAVGEGVDATRCHGAADCQDGGKCLTHDLWAELSQEINDVMRQMTLATLVTRQHKSAGLDNAGPANGATLQQSNNIDGAELIATRHL